MRLKIILGVIGAALCFIWQALDFLATAYTLPAVMQDFWVQYMSGLAPGLYVLFAISAVLLIVGFWPEISDRFSKGSGSERQNTSVPDLRVTLEALNRGEITEDELEQAKHEWRIAMLRLGDPNDRSSKILSSDGEDNQFDIRTRGVSIIETRNKRNRWRIGEIPDDEPKE
jgi:uncharacterized membrane protein